MTHTDLLVVRGKAATSSVAVQLYGSPFESIPDGMSRVDGVKSVIPPLAASAAKRRSIRRVPGGDGFERRPKPRTSPC